LCYFIKGREILLNGVQGYVGNNGSLPQNRGGHFPAPYLPDLESLSEADLDDMIQVLDSCLNPAGRCSPAAVRTVPKPRSKAGRIISAVLFYGLLVCLVGGAFLVSRGEKKPIFGYSFMNVMTWSMESAIPQGSMVIIRQVDPATIQIGDDITYTKDAETSVTHRVIGITENFEGSGERGFETQGVDNDTPDFAIVPAVHVAGMVKAHIPKVGNWLEWLRGNLTLTLGFTAGFVLLAILLKGAFKKNPKENPRTLKQPRRLLPAQKKPQAILFP